MIIREIWDMMFADSPEYPRAELPFAGAMGDAE